MTRVLLLSVRPRFAHGLLSGTKTAEIRRRFPDIPVGMTVIIYSTSPEKAILGTMRAKQLVRSNADDIWRDYADVIAIGRSELTEYLDGASECSVLELDRPNVWSRPVQLAELRSVLDLEPPQSFRYLTSRQLTTLHSLTRSRAAEDPYAAEPVLALA